MRIVRKSQEIGLEEEGEDEGDKRRLNGRLAIQKMKNGK